MTTTAQDNQQKNRDLKGKYLPSKQPEGVLALRPSTSAPGAAQFTAVSEAAYESVHGDTLDDLLKVRDSMREVLWGEYEDEFGFGINQDSTHPAVVDYQRVTLAALSNYVLSKNPTAHVLVLTESDDDIGSWGSMVAYDQDGAELAHITDEPMGEDSLATKTPHDLMFSFGFTTIEGLAPRAILVTKNKYDGVRATIDLTKAPRTLR